MTCHLREIYETVNFINILHFALLILKYFLLQHAAKVALQAAVYSTTNLSVCLSVRSSVHHTPVLCQNEGMQRDAVFTVG